VIGTPTRDGRRDTGSGRGSPLALTLVSLAALAALALTPAPTSRHRPAARPAPAKHAAAPAMTAADAAKLADEARAVEEIGGWARAAEILARIRAHAPRDPDLDLFTAWCEARSGAVDSAAAILAGPVLVKAGNDSLPATRNATYTWDHEETWLNAEYDGWYWYVWRTRVELAAARGRWDEALAAARRLLLARRRTF